MREKSLESLDNFGLIEKNDEIGFCCKILNLVSSISFRGAQLLAGDNLKVVQSNFKLGSFA